MRVREVLKDPTILDNFDFFNDTKDTLSYLRGVNTPESLALAEELERRDKTHWQKRNEEWRAEQAKG